ncbi:MAG: hypothetical protein Kow00121_64260 [Elainellaceae cyanobacterium]
MSDEFVELPTGDDRPVRSSRRSMRLFLIGKAEDVDKTIAELHSKQFGEAGLWSKPFECSGGKESGLRPDSLPNLER